MSDQEYVQAHWERADLCEDRGRASFTTSLGGRGFTRVNIPERQVDSAKRAWAAAAEFTRERLEQIEMAQWCVVVLESHLAELDGDSRRAAYVAIFEREKSALADLERGMKPTP